MIAVSTPGLRILLADEVLPGKPLTPIQAAAMNQLYISRIVAICNAHLKTNANADIDQLLTDLFNTYEFTTKMPEIADPIIFEARRIAETLLKKRMLTHGTLLDAETLAIHVAELAKHPLILDRASQIVAVKRTAAAQALENTKENLNP